MEIREKNSEKLKNSAQKYAFCYGLLAIPILHFIIFWLYVNFKSLALPFQNEITGAFTWDNFKNILGMIKSDPDLHSAFSNTLIYYVQGLITSYAVSSLFAYFLYKKVAGYKLYSVLFMLPQIISGVVMVAIYKYMLGMSGPISALYQKLFNTSMPNLLFEHMTGSIVGFSIWTGFGMNLILFSGAMAKIPPEIIESAQIEGVSFMQEFFLMVLPLIWPTMSMMLLLSVNGIFSASGPILLFLDDPSTHYGAITISHWFYLNVFMRHKYELASAFGLLLTIAGAPLTVIVVILRRKLKVDVEY